MSEDNKPNGVSRVSKLKKRRRPLTTNPLGSPESGHNLGVILGNAKDGVKSGASAGSIAFSHQVINEGDSLSISTSTVPPQYSSSDPVEMNRIEHACLHGGAFGETTKSIMGFIDYIDRSELLAAIPSIVGVDMERYNASNPEFVSAVNVAFPYRIQRRKRHAEFLDTSKRGNAFCHTLVGCIDFSAFGGCYRSKDAGWGISLAFPLSTSTEKDDTSASPCFGLPRLDEFMTPTHNTDTGNGQRIPLSFCRFPSSDKLVAVLKQNSNQSALELSPSVSAEQKNKHQLHKVRCQGRVRIEASIGASIREVYDIDKSKHVLGKLQHGDKRHFVAKTVLPPPPMTLDDSEEDECISVVRYKILLEPGDTTSSFAPRDELGRVIGWISDRGRLADDSYLILKEIPLK
ncbi:hypothetical protein ACHAW6_000781 [Cyclotella cf. meneghiniana]